jgi:predicted transcriptional regulator of viral defense system
MKLQISTKDHGVITSDETDEGTNKIRTIVDKALTDNGYVRFYVKGVYTMIPLGVLNTSIIKIIE